MTGADESTDAPAASMRIVAGNPTDDWRIAISERVFGDDIRWAPRPDCVNLAGVSFDEMLEGEAPMGSHFPLLWSEDGRSDGDADYPRGFATRSALGGELRQVIRNLIIIARLGHVPMAGGLQPCRPVQRPCGDGDRRAALGLPEQG